MKIQGFVLAVSLALVAAFLSTLPAQAATPSVTINSVTWNATTDKWDVKVTGTNVDRVWATTYRSPSFGVYHEYTSSDPNPESAVGGASTNPANPPLDAITRRSFDLAGASSATGTISVAPYTGAGQGSGNATYLRVYGWDGQARDVQAPRALVAPKLSSAGIPAYSVRAASLNILCTSDSCRPPALTQLAWPVHRQVLKNALLANPDLPAKPDIVGLQEVSQPADLADYLADDYIMADVADRRRIETTEALKCTPGDAAYPVGTAKIMVNSDKYTIVKGLISGNNVTGVFPIGCTKDVQERVASSANNPEIDDPKAYGRSAVYALVEQKANTGPGSGKRLWVISTQAVAGSRYPQGASDVRKREIFRVRAEARQQAAIDIAAFYDQVNPSYPAPIIVTGDFNSDMPHPRNGVYDSMQARLYKLGFTDGTGGGSTFNTSWPTANGLDPTIYESASNDPQRLDYIMFKGGVGTNNFRNHLLGYTTHSNGTATANSTQSGVAVSPPSDHNLQTAELRFTP